MLYDNDEFITIFEVINKHQENQTDLKEKLRILITLKEKLLMYYMDVSDAYHISLNSITVHCKDYPDLFRSFHYLFKGYESNVFSKLIDKLRKSLSCQNVLQVKGSTFVEALYYIYLDDVAEKEKIRDLKEKLAAKKNAETMSLPSQLSPSKKSMARNLMAEMDAESIQSETNSMAEMIQAGRQEFVTNHVTMARKAHTVTTTPTMVPVIDRPKKNLAHESSQDLLQELDRMDATIYKEGREKRAKQNLLENLMDCTKHVTQDYDALLDSMAHMEKLYSKLKAFCEKSAPNLLRENELPDFDKMEGYQSQKGFYMRCFNSGMFD